MDLKRKTADFFAADPFSFIDKFSLSVKGFEFNLLRDDIDLRKAVLRLTGVTLLFWLVMGWDSSASQLEMLLKLPWFIAGRITRADLIAVYTDQYGKGIHWSAMVIYGLCFYGLSSYYRNHLRLENSRNVCLSLALTLFSIGLFEHGWHISYYLFQHQAWILSFRLPQLRILLQTLTFTVLGCFTILFVHLRDGHHYDIGPDRVIQFTTYFPTLRLRWSKRFVLLASVAILAWLIWIYYPFPVESITVPIIGGSEWTSSPLFPQTVYTIETNLLDNINAGEQFFIENDLLHGWNTLTKVLVTAAIYEWGRFRFAE